MLSARGTVDDRVRGLREGADDYLGKPFSFAELVARVQALIRRRTADTADLTHLRIDDLEVDLQARKVTRAGLRLDLRSEEHTSELQSLMRISYPVFCLKKKTTSPDSPLSQIIPVSNSI